MNVLAHRANLLLAAAVLFVFAVGGLDLLASRRANDGRRGTVRLARSAQGMAARTASTAPLHPAPSLPREWARPFDFAPACEEPLPAQPQVCARQARRAPVSIRPPPDTTPAA